MIVNRKLMRASRRDPKKFMEILETADHAEMDRTELIEHLIYLGNDEMRIEKTSGNKISIGSKIYTMGALSSVGFIFAPPQYIMFAAVSGIVTITSLLYVINKLYFESNPKSYECLRSEALSNIESRILQKETLNSN